MIPLSALNKQQCNIKSTIIILCLERLEYLAKLGHHTRPDSEDNRADALWENVLRKIRWNKLDWFYHSGLWFSELLIMKLDKSDQVIWLDLIYFILTN